MPTLSTLVNDIYQVIEKGLAKDAIDTTKLAEMISARLSEEGGGGALRASNIGSPCDRKLWYTVNTPENAEPFPAHVRLKFIIGDIIEEVLLSIVEATDHVVTGRQGVIEIDGIKGHRDAIIDGVVVDVKSANSRSFDKFKFHKLEHDDPFGYIDQLGMYIEGSKDDPTVTDTSKGAFLAVDKELGHVVLDEYKTPKKDYHELVKSKKQVVSATRPPPRSYDPVADGKSGNMVLPVTCRYCAFKEPCWADVNGGAGLRKIVYANGPRWFTKIVKEPVLRSKF